MDADFLIQAGHQGLKRNQGTGSTASYVTAGLPGPDDDEFKLTPIVADEAARLLKAAGYTVVRENAYFDKKYSVKVAVSLHFDGAGTACASGTSVGYPAGVPAGSNKPTAELWKAAYLPYFPFKRMPDNFTAALRGYYGYAYTSTSVAEFLIEFGELTCPEQNAWLLTQVHNNWLAQVVAHVLDKAVGGNKIGHPGPPPVSAVGADNPELGDRLAAVEKALNEFIRTTAHSVSIDVQVSDVVVQERSFTLTVSASLDNLAKYVDTLKLSPALSEVSIDDVSASTESKKIDAVVSGEF